MVLSYQLVIRSRSCVVSSRVERSSPGLEGVRIEAPNAGETVRAPGCRQQIHQQPRHAVVDQLEPMHASLQLSEHDQLHQLCALLVSPRKLRCLRFVVDAWFPNRGQEDVHRQVLETFGDELNRVGFLFASLTQPIPHRRDRVVKRLCVIRTMLQHDQIGGELDRSAPANGRDARPLQRDAGTWRRALPRSASVRGSLPEKSGWLKNGPVG